jgi:hypothetical protein
VFWTRTCNVRVWFPHFRVAAARFGALLMSKAELKGLSKASQKLVQLAYQALSRLKNTKRPGPNKVGQLDRMSADLDELGFGQKHLCLGDALLAPEALIGEAPHDFRRKHRLAFLEPNLLSD